jgi:hypothetical protein
MVNKVNGFASYYYDDQKKILFRTGLESKHIIWTGDCKGSCAFNKAIYEKFPEALLLGFHYNGVRYSTTRELFNHYKVSLAWQEPQVACPLACYHEEKI